MPLSRVIPGNLFVAFFLGSVMAIASTEGATAIIDAQAQQKWVMSKETDKASFNPDMTRARLIIFRDRTLFDPAESEPINVMIDKNYHASLMPGHDARTLSLCPGRYNIQVAVNIRRALDLVDPASAAKSVTLAAGEVVYYATGINEKRELTLTQMDPPEAKEIAEKLETQTHTISRFYQKTCPDTASPAR